MCEDVVELSESFPIGKRVRQRCVISQWLLYISMNECMNEIKAKVGIVGA